MVRVVTKCFILRAKRVIAANRLVRVKRLRVIKINCSKCHLVKVPMFKNFITRLFLSFKICFAKFVTDVPP